MTELRDDLPVAIDEAGDPRAWVRPAVQRLSAGSAEDGVSGAPDALNFS